MSKEKKKEILKEIMRKEFKEFVIKNARAPKMCEFKNFSFSYYDSFLIVKNIGSTLPAAESVVGYLMQAPGLIDGVLPVGGADTYVFPQVNIGGIDGETDVVKTAVDVTQDGNHHDGLALRRIRGGTDGVDGQQILKGTDQVTGIVGNARYRPSADTDDDGVA